MAGLDGSAAMLAAVPPPVVRADAVALPFADAAFDAVVAVNVYDHLPGPLAAVRAAHRVLRPGGVLVAGTISRHDSPELAAVWRPAPTPFDTEEAPGIVGEVFADVRVDAWDAPLLALPDPAAVTDYLVARFVPAGRAARGCPGAHAGRAHQARRARHRSQVDGRQSVGASGTRRT